MRAARPASVTLRPACRSSGQILRDHSVSETVADIARTRADIPSRHKPRRCLQPIAAASGASSVNRTVVHRCVRLPATTLRRTGFRATTALDRWQAEMSGVVARLGAATWIHRPEGAQPLPVLPACACAGRTLWPMVPAPGLSGLGARFRTAIAPVPGETPCHPPYVGALRHCRSISTPKAVAGRLPGASPCNPPTVAGSLAFVGSERGSPHEGLVVQCSIPGVACFLLFHSFDWIARNHADGALSLQHRLDREAPADRGVTPPRVPRRTGGRDRRVRSCTSGGTWRLEPVSGFGRQPLRSAARTDDRRQRSGRNSLAGVLPGPARRARIRQRHAVFADGLGGARHGRPARHAPAHRRPRDDGGRGHDQLQPTDRRPGVADLRRRRFRGRSEHLAAAGGTLQPRAGQGTGRPGAGRRRRPVRVRAGHTAAPAADPAPDRRPGAQHAGLCRICRLGRGRALAGAADRPLHGAPRAPAASGVLGRCGRGTGCRCQRRVVRLLLGAADRHGQAAGPVDGSAAATLWRTDRRRRT